MPSSLAQDPDWMLEPAANELFIAPDAERLEEIEGRIDRYFNTPIDLFPYAESRRKPPRFHVIYEATIAERFPDDQDIRDLIRRYGRGVLAKLVGYLVGKRISLVLALIAILMILRQVPEMAGAMGAGASPQVWFALIGMALVYGVFAGVGAAVFSQYQLNLENRSFLLSKLIAQRSQEMAKLFTDVKAAPDLEETDYQKDGGSWGASAAYLVRLLIWVAMRLEHLERFIQVEMWRIRRERYWLDWAGRVLVAVIWLVWAWLVLQPPPHARLGGPSFYGVLQIWALAVGAATALSSYLLWKTPVDLVKDTLASGGWVRYADLDVDNVLGDQVRRDKARLVEYRNLHKAD